MTSRPCDDCFKIRQCALYRREEEGAAALRLAYLCRPCARRLGYLPKEAKS